MYSKKQAQVRCTDSLVRHLRPRVAVVVGDGSGAAGSPQIVWSRAPYRRQVPDEVKRVDGLPACAVEMTHLGTIGHHPYIARARSPHLAIAAACIELDLSPTQSIVVNLLEPRPGSAGSASSSDLKQNWVDLERRGVDSWHPKSV